jgi:CRP-like cAMP-binding protein
MAAAEVPIAERPVVPQRERFDPAILGVTPLLGGITDACRCVLTEHMEVLRPQAGTHVYREGDTAKELYVVARGRLFVHLKGAELGDLQPGDFFGEVSFLDMQPRHTSVVAMETSELYVVPYKALRSLYEVDVRAYALIVMNLGREVCRRLRTADRMIGAYPTDTRT